MKERGRKRERGRQGGWRGRSFWLAVSGSGRRVAFHELAEGILFGRTELSSASDAFRDACVSCFRISFVNKSRRGLNAAFYGRKRKDGERVEKTVYGVHRKSSASSSCHNP